ncbi:RAMP superfamily CRISPR-associated protein [Brucella daejeonensis]
MTQGVGRATIPETNVKGALRSWLRQLVRQGFPLYP